ncbi:MAG: DUF1640 domain-containing protein [Magnetococcales bacterium]|nr:DUF1640 domain-containing protein [Magnetococcales bacterium]
MSAAIPFDTLAFVKELEGAGIPTAQAEAQVKMLATVMRQMDARMDDLAARRDKQTTEKFDTLADRNEQQVKGRLDGLATKQELDFRLATVEANLKRDIEAAKSETIKWTAGMFAAQTALIIGAMFAVMKMNQQPAPVSHIPPPQEMRLPAVPPTPPASSTSPR